MADTLNMKNYKSIYTQGLVTDLFQKVKGHSSLARLSKSEPLPFNGKEYMTFSMDDEVNLVGESEAKAQGSAVLGTKTIIPLKVEYGIRTSDEFLYASEEKKIEILKAFNEGFAAKVARGLDIMAMHGVNPRSKTTSNLIGDNHFDAGSKTITTTPGAEDKDINRAIALFDDSDNYDVTGFAMSKAFRTSLSELEYKNGAAKFPELGWGNETSSLRGLKVDVNSTVSFNTSNDLAIIGDFEKYFKYGIAKEILMDIIKYGDPDNSGRDLKGHNEVFIRSEVYLGWAIMDPEAFARVVKVAEQVNVDGQDE